MIFDFHNEQDTERQDFTGSMPTGTPERLGMAVMRGGVKMANTALMAASALREDPEPLFKLHDEIIEPARKYWTPDEPSTSKAMQYLEAFSELPLQLVGGPATLAASTVMNKAEELVDAGVSPMTAVGVGTIEGAVQAATMTMPAAGKTIRQTLMLAGIQPVIGGVAIQGSKSILESQGFAEQAKAYDPFDIPGRGIELTLGLAFGGLAHYAKVKGKLPVEVVDAIDVVENQQKVKNASPFKETTSPASADVHSKAHSKALDDLHEGRPVDVSAEIREHVANSDMPYRTEPHPEEIRIRDIVGKETAALADEFAAEYPEGVRTRIMPPHQDAGPWSMTRDELFSARDNTRDWYDNLERSILGDQVKEWRQAVRRGDTHTTERIESRLKPEEVDALYGVGTRYAPDDFALLADARDTVRSGLELNGYTEKNLAGEIASALYKVGDKKEPGKMSTPELEAYVKLDEAFNIIQEHGMDSKAVSDEALRLAAGHFPDPEDALYMLKRFLNKDQQPASTGQVSAKATQIESIAIRPKDPAGTRMRPTDEQPNATHAQTAEATPATIHEAQDALTSDVETLLREHGDIAFVRHDSDGQQITVSARQILEDAKGDIERTRQLEKAYQRAALCLGFD